MKKENPWLKHLNKFRKENPKLAQTEVMKKAKQTYKKSK